MNFWEEVYSNFRQAVFSMSESLRDIGYRLRDRRESIIEHLLKLYFFRGSSWDRDWVIHTYKAVFWVPTKKGGHTFPPEDWLYDCLFGGIEDVWGNIYRGFLGWAQVEFRDWYPWISGVSRERETRDFVKCYMLWLARRLHESGEVSIDEVTREVASLQDAFPFDPLYDCG